MFLDKRPDIINALENETNINIEKNDYKIGQFELPFSMENELILSPGMAFSYTVQNIDNQHKLHIKQISSGVEEKK